MMRPLLARPHGRGGGLGTEKDAAQVHPDHPVPLLRGHLRDGKAAHQAREIDLVIKLSIGVHGALHHGGDALLVAHVHPYGQRFLAFGLQLGGEGLRVILPEIGDHDLNPVLGERGADRRSQAARPSGYDCDFRHVGVLLLVCGSFAAWETRFPDPGPSLRFSGSDAGWVSTLPLRAIYGPVGVGFKPARARMNRAEPMQPTGDGSQPIHIPAGAGKSKPEQPPRRSTARGRRGMRQRRLPTSGSSGATGWLSVVGP